MLWHKVGKSQYSDHQVEKDVLVLKLLVQNCFTFLTKLLHTHLISFFPWFLLCVNNTLVLIPFSFKNCAGLTFLLAFLHYLFLHCSCLSVSSSKTACLLHVLSLTEVFISYFWREAIYNPWRTGKSPSRENLQQGESCHQRLRWQLLFAQSCFGKLSRCPTLLGQYIGVL